MLMQAGFILLIVAYLFKQYKRMRAGYLDRLPTHHLIRPLDTLGAIVHRVLTAPA